jgi:MFS superfamily sulfate permease-like transporter
MIDLHPFRPRLLDSLASYDSSRLLHEIGAGIAVGIVALPLAMAFAIASGVKPEQGLVTAIANVNEQPLSLIQRSSFEQLLGPEQIAPTVSAAFDDARTG